MDGVDGEWVLGVFMRVPPALQQALVAMTKPLAQLLPEPLVIIQGPHEEVLVAVENVLAVPVSVEQMKRLGLVAARHDGLPGVGLYEGSELPPLGLGAPDGCPRDLLEAGLQRSLENLVNVQREAAPSVAQLLCPRPPPSLASGGP